MAGKLFAGFQHASVYHKFRPMAPLAVVEKIINYMKEKITEPFELALDVGCGTGQCTSVLSPYFKKAIGIDISDAQIKEANESNTLSNVEYRLCSVKEVNLDNETVQLITASQSAHWFDLPEFYKIADQLLAPFGVLAFIGYRIPLPFLSDKNIEKAAKETVLKFYNDDLGTYWAPERAHVDSFYKDFSLPYVHNIRTVIPVETQTTVSDYCGYFESWSSYQSMKKEDSEKADFIMNRFQTKLKDLLNQSLDNPLTLQTEHFILMARKDGSS